MFDSWTNDKTDLLWCCWWYNIWKRWLCIMNQWKRLIGKVSSNTTSWFSINDRDSNGLIINTVHTGRFPVRCIHLLILVRLRWLTMQLMLSGLLNFNNFISICFKFTTFMSIYWTLTDRCNGNCVVEFIFDCGRFSIGCCDDCCGKYKKRCSKLTIIFSSLWTV